MIAKDLRLGRSVLVSTVVAVAVAIATLASELGTLSVARAQATVTSPIRRTETEQYAAAQRNAARYREIFDPATPDNPIPGKSYRDLTAEDFQRLPRYADVVIVSALLYFSSEYYDVIDSMKPSAMTREQFSHVLLREAARRDILGQILNNNEYVPRTVANQNVTISRPQDVPAVQRTSATIPARDAVYRDLATSLLQNPRAIEVAMQGDIKDQTGLNNTRYSVFVDNDMDAVIIGYAAGANPLFFNGNQAGRPAGPLPLSLGFDRSVTIPQLHEAYCAIVPAIVQPGRARGVDQNMAVSAGFLMAREDAANGFASNDISLAFRGEPCRATPVPWDHRTMGRAITGIDLLPQQATARP